MYVISVLMDIIGLQLVMDGMMKMEIMLMDGLMKMVIGKVKKMLLNVKHVYNVLLQLMNTGLIKENKSAYNAQIVYLTVKDVQ